MMHINIVGLNDPHHIFPHKCANSCKQLLSHLFIYKNMLIKCSYRIMGKRFPYLFTTGRQDIRFLITNMCVKVSERTRALLAYLNNCNILAIQSLLYILEYIYTVTCTTTQNVPLLGIQRPPALVSYPNPKRTQALSLAV